LEDTAFEEKDVKRIIVPSFLFQTCFATLREENVLRIFENEVLRPRFWA
jgi:hypothetical protein